MLYMIADAKFFVGMLLVSVVGILILVKPTRRKKNHTPAPVAEPVAEETPVEEAAAEAAEEAPEVTPEQEQ